MKIELRPGKLSLKKKKHLPCHILLTLWAHEALLRTLKLAHTLNDTHLFFSNNSRQLGTYTHREEQTSTQASGK